MAHYSRIEARPDMFTPSSAVKEHDDVAVCYQDTVKATGINPKTPWERLVRPVSKRDRQRAGRLTGRVWEALSANPTANTSELTWDTAEQPEVKA